MVRQIQISAKNLGELALPDFCPRCFWLKRHPDVRLPYQIFPGIFSSIDAYTKRVVHGYFDKHGRFPAWLDKKIGDLVGYVNPPSFHKFNRMFEEYGIRLTGAADAIFQKKDGSHVIVDYKTAKFTPNADKLMPMYVVQLNGYASIAEEVGPQNVTSLGLLYMEPITDEESAVEEAHDRGDGFAMGFSANYHPVILNTEMILPLLEKTREICDLETSPDPRAGCKECEKVSSLVNVSVQFD